ncbi:MAG: YlbF family regulator [Roseibacillus sp.]|nr:YlbF family regulator [Roseibacillus sp.]
MTILAENSPVMDKTKELCAAIAGDPEYQSLLGKVERFMGDDAAKLQFQSVQERSHELGQKQQAGLELSVGEVEEFEAAREALMGNSVAREFMDAQQSLQTVQMAIGKYVGMTLDLGRVPAEEDLADEGGCCNEGGCGCS